jgi:hypothetical protein
MYGIHLHLSSVDEYIFLFCNDIFLHEFNILEDEKKNIAWKHVHFTYKLLPGT